MVSFRILQAMLLVIGIEMASGRLEVWPIALGSLMDVDGMVARRQVLKVELDVYTLLARRTQGGCAHVFTLSILQLDGGAFVLGLCCCQSKHREQNCRECKTKFHLSLLIWKQKIVLPGTSEH